VASVHPAGWELPSSQDSGKITAGQGRPEDLELMEKVSWTMKEASLCGLGRTAANPVLSVLRYFRTELEKHVIDRECPAGVCRGLISYQVDRELCTACLLCLEACPVKAMVVADDGYPSIDQILCTRCGACYLVCPPGISAIKKLIGKMRESTGKLEGSEMSGAVIKLRINQQMVEARPGMTVLECARSNGQFIPSLCDLEGLPAFAGCRLCLVEIAGRPHRSPACQTLVEEGMDITTTSPELEKLRLATLELILSEHPYFCLLCQERPDCDQLKTTMVKALEPGGCVFCPKDGACELQRVAEYLKLKRYPSISRIADGHSGKRTLLYFTTPISAFCAVAVCGFAPRSGEKTSSVSSGVVRRRPLAPFWRGACGNQAAAFCGACLDVCPVAAFNERGESRPEDAKYMKVHSYVRCVARAAN